ncbi:hypothetical protein [Streptomyces sp. KL116D]|uniref:SCO6745 family protein n=1 Tax=Streptomyces sp. KL116D TaxID=3045152 RepID=UPI003557C767
MWHLLEPLHAVLYYAPEAFEEAAALGYEVGERWPRLLRVAGRPAGRARRHQVASAFYSFNPAMVAEHVPAAWEVASPDDVLAARLRGVDRAYRALFGDVLDGPELSRAADLARRAAEAVHVEGRPLAAANAELPWPDALHLVLWQAATVLREHRGDGHVAALLTAAQPADSGVVRGDRRGAPGDVREPRLDPEPVGRLAPTPRRPGPVGRRRDRHRRGPRAAREVETMTDRLATGPLAVPRRETPRPNSRSCSARCG